METLRVNINMSNTNTPTHYIYASGKIGCYFPVKIGTLAVTKTLAWSRRSRYSRVPLYFSCLYCLLIVDWLYCNVFIHIIVFFFSSRIQNMKTIDGKPEYKGAVVRIVKINELKNALLVFIFQLLDFSH